MKKLINIFALCFIALSFIACEEEDEFTFIASPEQTADFTFTNSISENYLLSPLVADNPAERFVWNEADFDVQTPVNYELQGAVTEDFNNPTTLADITGTDYSVTVSSMLSLANEAGLDNDPDTEEAPNTGMLYFRVRAYVGADAGNVVEQFSDILTLNVELVENTSEEVDLSTTWGVTGGATEFGWEAPDVPMWKSDITGVDNLVYVAYTTLTDGEIKFRENETWSNDYGGADGQLVAGGANIEVTEGTYKITIDLNPDELTYSLEEYSWGIVGSATPNGWDGPDIQLSYNGENNTWMAENVTLTDGEIKFRLNNTWGGDYGGNDGQLGSDNIAVTAGTYTIIVDFENGTYTIE